MASLLLKQIESGSVTFTGAENTKTITLATTLTDTSKTRLRFSWKNGSGNVKDYLVTGTVLSTTQIQFQRDAGVGNDATVNYEVLEYTQGITVQHLVIQINATSIDTTISTVNLSKAYVELSTRGPGNNFDENHTVVGELTSTTNLQLRCFASNLSKYAGIQVIEIDDAAVQAFVTTFGTGATKDITVTTINPLNTYWVFSLDVGGVIDIYGEDLPYLSYVDPTTLRFTRAGAAATDFSIVLYVVSVSKGVTVQNISTGISSSGNSVSPTIPSAVIVANTELLLNGMFQTLASINVVNDDGGGFAFTLDNLTTTGFTASRIDSPALAATTNVQVISYVTNDNWFLLACKNGIYNAQNINGMR